MEKAVKETNKAMEEAFFGKKKKQGGKEKIIRKCLKVYVTTF